MDLSNWFLNPCIFLESLQHLVTVNFINVNCVKRFFSSVCSVVCDIDDFGYVCDLL